MFHIKCGDLEFVKKVIFVFVTSANFMLQKQYNPQFLNSFPPKKNIFLKKIPPHFFFEKIPARPKNYAPPPASPIIFFNFFFGFSKGVLWGWFVLNIMFLEQFSILAYF